MSGNQKGALFKNGTDVSNPKRCSLKMGQTGVTQKDTLYKWDKYE